MYVYHDNDNRVTILSQIDLTRVGGGGGGGHSGKTRRVMAYQVPEACSLLVKGPRPSWCKCV